MTARRLAIAACALALLGAEAAQAQGTTITAQASKTEIVYGKTITISGQAGPAEPVTLQKIPYPFDADWQDVETQTTAVDGTYGFTDVKPDRNTRYRVIAGASASPILDITVDEKLTSEIAYQSLGRARIRIRSEHPPDLDWGDHKAYWYVAEGSSDTFRRVRRNRSKQGSAGVTKLSATFRVPAGKFRFFECFSAPGKEARRSSRLR